MHHDNEVTAFKAFTRKWRCRDFQYSVGETYTHAGELLLGLSGFHACSYPLDVLGYYQATGRFAQVTLAGVHPDMCLDSKRVARRIRIDKELSPEELVEKAQSIIANGTHHYADAEPVGNNSWVAVQNKARGVAVSTYLDSVAIAAEKRSHAQALSDNSVAVTFARGSLAHTTSGRSVAATSGFTSVAATDGEFSAAVANMDYSAATTQGAWSAAVCNGYGSIAITAGENSAAVATRSHSLAKANGKASIAVAIGPYSAASADSSTSVAVSTGSDGIAKAAEGGALFLVERSRVANWPNDQLIAVEGEIINVWCGIAGRDGIKPDTYYRLVNGKPVEA